jgi:hypothetical protein
VAAGYFDACWRARKFSLDVMKVMKDMAPINGRFPRTIWHNPINLAENFLAQCGTYEIGDRNAFFGWNPPHIMVRIHVYQDAARCSRISPNR